MKRIVFTLTALTLFVNAFADVQITVKDGFGGNSTFSSNGQLVRIDGQKMDGFIVIDYASGDFFMVDSKQGEVKQASLDQIDATQGAAPLSITIEDKGDGPKIAGYLTRKFEMIVSGEGCGTVYASSKLLQNRDVRAIFESMRNMQEFSSRIMGGMSGIMPVCQRANMQLADVIESSGAPLRVVNKGGKMLSEVLTVVTDKKYAADHYALPAGMKVVDMTEQMNQATQQTQQMKKMMEQLQQQQQ